ncbi:expressed unknown protein [Ectocarpus siliculosus]|uniref:Uncharacterized protein n=1 Tax=Ectocarpus siliculosus TaxID=2880 RepID=D7G088_ECTSI|nr:expressed unknown protein [Ectocarpus siliculosus]|eukprot:CBJ32970.1 expressed unknown protein [Ectocarpus siliculosus]
MCNTAVLAKMRQVNNNKPSCFRRQRSAAVPHHQEHRRTKREREAQRTAGRPAKRVSFSANECVLGRAQDYDRTSCEVQTPLVRRRIIPKRPAPVVIIPSDEEAKQQQDQEPHEQQHANFCGMWRRSHGFHWESLLEFSGVDKADVAEQAARMQSSSVVHLIDHDANSFRLVVHSDSGNTQDQHFFIGGQPRPSPTNAPSTATLSNMRWTKNGQGLVLTSVDAATGDEMTVSRHLAAQGSVIVQHYAARRAKTGETAEAVTIFRRMVRATSSSTSEPPISPP